MLRCLQLGNIDVSETSNYKDVVFCVYSEKPGIKYYLQLAHTTNIGFNYEIYTSELSPEDGKLSYLGKNYKMGELLEGAYLNKESGTNYATKTYHGITYPNSSGNQSVSYDNVQKFAEPLYWKSTNEEVLPEKKDDTGYYVNYYILRIKWDENVNNNKETDMIYIMA